MDEKVASGATGKLLSHGDKGPKSVASSQSQVAGSNFVPCFHHHTRHSSHGQPMAWTEHEFSDEALRASLRAAAFTRAARGTAVTPALPRAARAAKAAARKASSDTTASDRGAMTRTAALARPDVALRRRRTRRRAACLTRSTSRPPSQSARADSRTTSSRRRIGGRI